MEDVNAVLETEPEVEDAETQADRIERKLDEVIAFKDSVEAALERLEGHPMHAMIGKMFGGNGGGS